MKLGKEREGRGKEGRKERMKERKKEERKEGVREGGFPYMELNLRIRC